MYCWADLTRTDGVLVWMSDSHDVEPDPLQNLGPGLHRIVLTIPAFSVGHGDYVLTLAFTGFQGGAMPVDNLDSVCALRVDDFVTKRGNQRPGSICAPGRWQVQVAEAPVAVAAPSPVGGGSLKRA